MSLFDTATAETAVNIINSHAINHTIVL